MLKNLPTTYKPKGKAREKLAYISDVEAQMLLALTDGKSNMTEHGVPSYYMEGGFSKSSPAGPKSSPSRAGGTGPGGAGGVRNGPTSNANTNRGTTSPSRAGGTGPGGAGGTRNGPTSNPSTNRGATSPSRAGGAGPGGAGGVRNGPTTNPSTNQGLSRMPSRPNGPGGAGGIRDGVTTNPNTNPSFPGRTPTGQQQSLNRMANALGVAPGQVDAMLRTGIGETAGEDPFGQAAALNTMMNRLKMGKKPGSMGYLGQGDVDKMLKGYDANGLRGIPANSVYTNAAPGTSDYGAQLNALAGAIAPKSTFNTTAPAALQNATHYLTRAAKKAAGPGHWSNSPQYNRTQTVVGNHVFGNAEDTADQVAALRSTPAAPASYTPTPRAPTQVAARTAPMAAPPAPQRPTPQVTAGPQAAPPAPQVAAPPPGPSWTDRLKGAVGAAGNYANAAYNGYTKANQQINSLGGPENAVTLARMFGGPGADPSTANQRTAERGLSRLPTGKSKSKKTAPVVVAQGPQFSWVQWAPGQQPVQVPNQMLSQGSA